jgi:hypothetical protein
MDRLPHNLGYNGNVRAERIQVDRAREPSVVVHATFREYAAEK